MKSKGNEKYEVIRCPLLSHSKDFQFEPHRCRKKPTFSVSDPSEPGQVKIGADLIGDSKLVPPETRGSARLTSV